MTLEAPLFLQAEDYSAREFRQLTTAALGEGVINKTGDHFKVTQRAAGANFTVDVAAGQAVIVGDGQANQGAYVVQSTAVESVTVPAPPGVGTRIDLLVARVRDSSVTGTDDDFILEVVQGTVGNPAPAVPGSAIPLAEISVSAAQASILNANITDRRTLSVAQGAVSKEGGTFTGKTTHSAGIDVTATGGVTGEYRSSSIELGKGRTGDGTPFIDFHSKGGSGNDYDARIIATGGVAGLHAQAAVEVVAQGGFTHGGATVARIATGSYTGDGTPTRSITLPFTAKKVEVAARLSGVRYLTPIGGSTVGLKLDPAGMTSSSDVQLTTNAFTVKTAGGASNDAGIVYDYIAIG